MSINCLRAIVDSILRKTTEFHEIWIKFQFDEIDKKDFGVS